jgi:hypothetical protein
MADLPVPRNESQIARPNVKVHKLRLEQQIAEKQARARTLRNQAQEIIEAKLKGIEADTIMVEREIVVLQQKLDEYDRRDEAEVIDVNNK